MPYTFVGLRVAWRFWSRELLLAFEPLRSESLPSLRFGSFNLQGPELQRAMSRTSRLQGARL